MPNLHPKQKISRRTTILGFAALAIFAGSMAFATPRLAQLASHADSEPTPSPTPSWAPAPSPSASPSPSPSPTPSTVTVMAAGDIACSADDQYYNGGNGTANHCQMKAVSNLIVKNNPDGILALGDLQYTNTLANWRKSFDPTWGQNYLATGNLVTVGKMFPTVGNHEYDDGGSDYLSYFGPRLSSIEATGSTAQHYYSFDLGAWHIVALNANCSIVSCAAGSAQEQWLKNDLATHTNACTMAIWHQPRFFDQSGSPTAPTLALWQDLYNANTDLILNGHVHNYERFAPQNPAGAADPARGITEIVVGTGGEAHVGGYVKKPNSVAYSQSVFGALKLTLSPTNAQFQFLPIAGSTYTDSGTVTCH